jgi:hypothetical protein
MPCYGPTEEEMSDMERFNNKMRFGKAWDDAQFAGNVACVMGKYIDSNGKDPLPLWAKLWWEDHKKQDAEKSAENKRQKADDRKREEMHLEKLARKLGKKIV